MNASKCIRMCAGAPAYAGAFVCRGQHSTRGTVPQEPSTLTLEMRSSHWDSTVGQTSPTQSPTSMSSALGLQTRASTPAFSH